MSFAVVVLPKAKDEWNSIVAWLAERSPTGAERLWISLSNAFKSLEENPGRFPLAPESEALSYEIRQLLFRTRKGRTYRVLFDIQGATVRILRIRGPGQRLLEPDEFSS